MVSMTLAIPQELKKEMDRHPELNWSEIARNAIRQKLLLLEKMNRLLAKSTLTETEAVQMGRELNAKLAKRYAEMA